MMRLVLALLAAVPASAHARDPFAAPSSSRPATPLERVEVDRLRLVGLVYGPVPRALLEDDAGGVHRATVGTPLGPRGGAVAAIEPGRLRVREPGGDDVVLVLASPGAPPP